MGTQAGAELAEIEGVYRRRHGELRRVATAITGSSEAGLDAVQDAFAIAIDRRSQFRGEGTLEAWLWRIVVHSARDLAGRRSSRPTAELQDDAIENTHAAESSRQGEIHDLLSHLPERQRHALFLRYYAAIADVLGIRSGTVGATLTQARENLRRLMTGVKP